ncbi:hypothetical protein Bhyg_08732 [Pseudolycoriella hygida]|uniref:Uncharacterized protein n=1 Tax=Pseudolycoriella hygida TaxID=35572 RepID=A0A9Q0S390_9DIPT|nr:hypothetical protein Bhyg_08732 [Pseudolycoriella hygida]
MDSKFNTFYIVNAFDIYSNCLIMLVSYFIQINNRKKLVDTINAAIVIRNNLKFLSPNEIIFAKSFCKHLRRISFTSFIQGTLFVWYCLDSWRSIRRTNAYLEFVLGSCISNL